MVEVIRELTKENDTKEIDQCIYIADEIERKTYIFPWIESFVPYSSDKYLAIMFRKINDSVHDLPLIYRNALSVSKNRLDQIINYISSTRRNIYDEQLALYITGEDYWNDDEDQEDDMIKEDLNIFLTIVTEIIRLGKIDYKTIPIIQNSKFELWVDRTENQV